MGTTRREGTKKDLFIGISDMLLCQISNETMIHDWCIVYCNIINAYDIRCLCLC